MKIDIKDPRVSAAVRLVKTNHRPASNKELNEIFEKQYHCKIVIEDEFCTKGHLHISEEKYQTWFLVQFGDTTS